MTKRPAEVGDLDIQVLVYNIPGFAEPHRFRVSRTALIDDLKQGIVDLIFEVHHVRVYRSSFRLLQGGRHRPYNTEVGAPGSSFSFEWSQPGPQ